MSRKAQREELAGIIFEWTGFGPFPDSLEFSAADAILEAGYTRPEDVLVPPETLRLLIHWAAKGGAEHGLFSTRKALSEAQNALRKYQASINAV